MDKQRVLELAMECGLHIHWGDAWGKESQLLSFAAALQREAREDCKSTAPEPEPEPTLRAKDVAECVWTHEYDTCSWDTACGHSFYFEDGTPADNGCKFCMYCGGKLIENNPDQGDDD